MADLTSPAGVAAEIARLEGLLTDGSITEASERAAIHNRIAALYNRLTFLEQQAAQQEPDLKRMRTDTESDAFPFWESLCEQDTTLVQNSRKLLLSTPNIFSQPINENIKSMYIRRCYIDLLEIMRQYLSSSRSGGGGATTAYKRMGLTGTPGIGKSAFIMYIIFDMLHKPPKGISHILLQKSTRDSIIIELNNPEFPPPRSVHDFSNFENKASVLYMIDGEGPMLMNWHDRNPILWISSPRSSEKFKNYFYKEAMSCQLCMPIWSKDEVQQIADDCHQPNVMKLFAMYGGIAKFFLSPDQGILSGAPIEEALSSRDDVVKLLGSQGHPSKDFPASHTLFHIMLPPTDESLEPYVQSGGDDSVSQITEKYSFYRHFVSVASNYIFDKLIAMYHEDVLKNIVQTVDTNDDRSFKGRMYEKYVIYLFKKNMLDNDTCKFRKLTPSSSSSSTSSSTPSFASFDFSCIKFDSFNSIQNIIDADASTAGTVTGTMLVPESPYQPVFDFLCYNKDTFDLIQVTIADKHPVRGVEVLKKVLSCNTSSIRTSRLIFVVPSNRFDSFKFQSVLTTNDQVPKSIPVVDQFVLSVNIPDISSYVSH